MTEKNLENTMKKCPKMGSPDCKRYLPKNGCSWEYAQSCSEYSKIIMEKMSRIGRC